MDAVEEKVSVVRPPAESVSNIVCVPRIRTVESKYCFPYYLINVPGRSAPEAVWCYW